MADRFSLSRRGLATVVAGVAATALLVAAERSAPAGSGWRASGESLTTAGPVGIGTESPQSALAVRGAVTAQEVVVTLDGWPDFVFDPAYPLLPLEELERYVERHRRLPGLPAAKDVHAEGLRLGEMEGLLAQRIEELVLYAFALRDENRDLERRVEALERRARGERP